MSNSVGIVKTLHYTCAHPPHQLLLTNGKKIGPLTIAYETYGKLNASKSNAILLCHALTGDAHAAGLHSPSDKKPGWWDEMVGPGKAFDTDRYFVVCSNILGGCKGTTGPNSINPDTNKPYGLAFPVITIRDMVEVQRMLLDHLGIESLFSIAGGSMGGMQVLEWMTRYPQRVKSAIVIASTSKLSAQALAFDIVGRNAIIMDPDWKEGLYSHSKQPNKGLSIARMIGHITYLSDESMHAKFGRKLQGKKSYSYDFSTEFQVESYLNHQGQVFTERFDANSYLYVTKAMDYFDLADEAGGSLDQAFRDFHGRSLFLSFSSDWLFPPAQSEEIVSALAKQGKDVSYCKIESSYGHDAFLLEFRQITRLIKNFLDANRAKGLL
jgi:homoserine O-acetyltransferase